MHEMIKACLTSTTTSSSPKSTIPIINIKIPHKIQESTIEKPKYTAGNPTSYTISSPTAAIPKLTEVCRKRLFCETRLSLRYLSLTLPRIII
jgi:hypothetical protein